ncbi:MAG: PDZ domain-containing protein [Phycisphaerales bacterium]|nr:PDZ domain-containing protein [Phycisphaerales bacterium]
MSKGIIGLVAAAALMLAAIVVSRSAVGSPQAASTRPQTRRTDKPPAAITGAIAHLASARWRTRHEAQQYLLLHGRAYLPLLLVALKHAASPEQADRLENISLQFYLSQKFPSDGPAPFIGIEFMIESVRLELAHHQGSINAACVQELLPGFYAARVLSPGDLIVAVNRHWLTSASEANDFRQFVQSYKPGAFVTLKVLRGGKVLQIPVRLHGMPDNPQAQQDELDRRAIAAKRFVARFGR